MEAAARRAVLLGVAVGVGASTVLVAYWLSVGALEAADLRRALRSRTAAKDILGIYLLGGVVTFGVPTALYARFGLVSPAVVLGGVAAVWGTARGGDSPASLFLLALWPGYLVAYLALGGVELWVRRHETPW